VYRDWAEGRGIFHNPSKTFLVWVNEEDQLRIISMQPGGDIGAVFTRLMAGIAALEKKLHFIFDDQRGFIATCPSNLGTGMRASVHINLPHASKDPRFKQICDELHLQPRGADGEHSSTEGSSLFDISPLKRLGLTEVDCAKALHAGATRLIALEKELRAAGHGHGAGAGAGHGETDESKIEIAHEFPDLSENSDSFMKKCLTREVYEALKDKRTDLGVTLYDVIKVGVLDKKCKLGAVAGDEASYHVFSALMDPVIEGYHRGYKLSSGHFRDLDPSHLGDAAVNPDPTGEFISSTRIRVARNLVGFPLPCKVNKEQRFQIEKLAVEALNSLEGELAGEYYSLTSMSDEVRVRLEKDHFLFRKEHGYVGRGRGGVVVVGCHVLVVVGDAWVPHGCDVCADAECVGDSA
jgi:creatine kinase